MASISIWMPILLYLNAGTEQPYSYDTMQSLHDHSSTSHDSQIILTDSFIEYHEHKFSSQFHFPQETHGTSIIIPKFNNIIFKIKNKQINYNPPTDIKDGQWQREYLTPASPTIPMAIPAESPARPQARPDDR